jgi:hypothetical protein
MSRAELIAQYRNGYAEVVAALHGATAEEMERTVPGEWSARQIAHHLADSETNSYVRLRKLLAEENPTLQGYDENIWAEVLHYTRPIEASLAVFQAVRVSSAELLDCLTEADWLRCGTHSHSGAYSMQTWLELYAPHAHDHADQIRRARLGYP